MKDSLFSDDDKDFFFDGPENEDSNELTPDNFPKATRRQLEELLEDRELNRQLEAYDDYIEQYSAEDHVPINPRRKRRSS